MPLFYVARVSGQRLRGCGIGVWAGSVFAALIGVLTLLLSPPAVTEARRAVCQLPTPAKAADNNAELGKN